MNPHGTSTPQGDAAETKAIKEVFGDHAAALRLVDEVGHGPPVRRCRLLRDGRLRHRLRDRILPPTINYRDPDPDCDLDYVPEGARRGRGRVALSNSMGLGGHNGCVVLRRYRG